MSLTFANPPYSVVLPENAIRAEYPTLWQYFQHGIELGIAERYLCHHRSPWYSQEQRAPAPLICTYMGRQSSALDSLPFRFILNHSNVIAANVYLLLYPRPEVDSLFRTTPDWLRQVWQKLNLLSAEQLIGEGRTYGGKLHKLEPRELANVRLDNTIDFHIQRQAHEQLRLLEGSPTYVTEKHKANILK